MRPIQIICNICSKFVIDGLGEVEEETFVLALCKDCKEGKEIFIDRDKIEKQFQELIKDL